jgi:hypothetical protein
MVPAPRHRLVTVQPSGQRTRPSETILKPIATRTAVYATTLLAAIALPACGDDDEEQPAQETRPQTAPPPTTPTEPTPAPAGEAGPRVKEIVSCLEGAGKSVIDNPGGSSDEERKLVVDAGFGGIVYVYSDEAAARQGKAKVDVEEKDTDREIEVVGDSVIAYTAEEGSEDLEKCLES